MKVQEVVKTLLSFLLILSINCLRGKASGDQDTHQRAQVS